MGEISGFLALLVSVVTAAISVIVLQSIRWYVRWKEERKDTYKVLFEKIHEVYTILNILVAETGAKRALIIRAENGGGIPELGKHLHSSIIYESVSVGSSRLKDSWQGQTLDQEHVSILRRVHSEDYYSTKVLDLPDCMLRDFLEADGVEYVLKVLVNTRQHFIYLSLHYGSVITPNASLRNKIRSSVGTLRKMF